MIDFVAALTSLTKGFEVLKTMKEIDKNLDAATYKARIAELMSAVADAKIALVDARDEVATKVQGIAKLKEGLRIRRDNTLVVQGFRYEKGENGQPIGMPFCTRCDTVDVVLIRVRTREGESKAAWPQCKADFGFQHGYPYPAA